MCMMNEQCVIFYYLHHYKYQPKLKIVRKKYKYEIKSCVFILPIYCLNRENGSQKFPKNLTFIGCKKLIQYEVCDFDNICRLFDCRHW